MFMPARRIARLLVVAVFVCLLGAACGTAPPPSAVPPPPSPSPSASPAPAYADTIRIALGECGCGPLGPFDNGSSPITDDDKKAAAINNFLHDALYRWDPHLRPTPSLASSCTPSPDGLTITCNLIKAVFSNGLPLTAADVAFTYRLISVHTPIDVWTAITR